MTKEKRAEIREQIKGGKMFFNTELLQALDALDLAESHLSKARETLKFYADYEKNASEDGAGEGIYSTLDDNDITWTWDEGEKAQQCLKEIGGKDA